MKSIDLNGMHLSRLSPEENVLINGGCEGMPCIGYLFAAMDAVEKFWTSFKEGFLEGLNEGIGDGKNAY